MPEYKSQIIPDCYLTPRKVCEDFPGFTIWKLERGRRDGTGARYIKNGRQVLYRRSAIEEWLDSREFISTAEAKMAGVH